MDDILNKFGTDDKHEYEVNDFLGHIAEWNKLLQPRKAKVLIINEMSLVFEYAKKEYENEVVYVSTTKSNIDFVKQHVKGVFALHIGFSRLKSIAKILEVRNMVTFDFIVGNPPYCGDLFLNISQQLQPYLTKDGKMFILAPTACLDNPSYFQYKQVYANLFSHLESLTALPDEIKNQFDSFNGFSKVGIYKFAKETVNRDINIMWEALNDEQFVEIKKKIKTSNVKMVADVMVRNTANGIIVPIADIGGAKRFMSYALFKYCNDGICTTLIKGKNGMLHENRIPISQQKEGVKDNKIYCGLPCSTIQQAENVWRLYRHKKLMRGLITLAQGGSAHIDRKEVPYFPCLETIPTDKEIAQALNLNEDNVKYLKKIAE